MIKFLDRVARYYLSKNPDQRHTTLVFPNKRGVLFMRRYLKNAACGPVFMPRLTTLGAFLGSLVHLEEASQLEQLFTLYDAYSEVMTGHGSEVPPFDRFRFWGEMMLDDFDDMDRQLVDTDAIFKNLKDRNEIATNYLSKDQRAVAIELWGYDPGKRFEEFWGHYNHRKEGKAEDILHREFTTLAEILGPTYHRFNEMLSERGLTTRGRIARRAAENIDRILAAEHTDSRFGFVGFDVLTKSERVIFSTLQKLDKADFFWDEPVVIERDFPENSRKSPIPLGKYVKRIVRDFPMPADFGSLPVTKAPDIEIISVPSRTMQAKVAANILADLGNRGLIYSFTVDNTAVVLPDASMLVPVLHSLPESAGAINITMGLPMRHTPFATLLSLITTMQARGRNDGDDYVYLTEDVARILTHPSISVIFPGKCSALRKTLTNNPRFHTTLSMIREQAPELAFVFEPVNKRATAGDACDYLVRIIDGMENAIRKNTTTDSDTADTYELELLNAYRKAVEVIIDMIKRHTLLTAGLSANSMTFFYLVEKLVRRENLNLSGSPLRGIQIMGVLETRSLDFDNVIALSMNEKTFPPKHYIRSLIPGALASYYGMTTAEEREMQYSWIFYNLIGRAGHVKLLYDSTSEIKGRGGKSRYLLQLENIFTANPPRITVLTPASHKDSQVEISVPKNTEIVRTEMSRFKSGGDRNLSASALKNYMKCPLMFYLKNVKKIAEAKKPTEYIDPASLGTIAHNVLQILYERYVRQGNNSIMDVNVDIPREVIADVLAHEMDDKLYFGRFGGNVSLMPGEAKMLHGQLTRTLSQAMAMERERRPYTFVGAEVQPGTKDDRSFDWDILPGLTVRFTYAVDRIDRLESGALRFIDYKSGSDKLYYTNLESLFHKGKNSTTNDAVFQLLTYAHAYNDYQATLGNTRATPIEIEIVKIFSPGTSLGIKPGIGSSNKINTAITNHLEDPVLGFKEMLQDLIGEIFNENKPFDQTDDIENCRYCQFLNICHRVVPDKKW